MSNSSNQGTSLSFVDLFQEKKCTVEVPIIQRDYAQGRENKAKIRTKFLRDLKQSLVENKPLDLDFVYGTIDKERRFIPLDGQQRLTTLFLLHWYLAQKEGGITKTTFRKYFQNKDNANSNFTYETRISSREFCNALVRIDLDFDLIKPSNKNDELSANITDNSWYYLSWNNDPTISGMLRMLDAIHFHFKDTNGLFDKLISTEKPLITFEFLDLPSFGLTDDLYIKMNARGKSLTEFENFKAQFIQLLEKKHPILEKEFASKIDGVWCDLFWDYSVNHPEEASYKIDNQLLQYFDYITEILFYKDFGKEELIYDFTDFDLVENIYQSADNVLFLMQSFDLFSTKKTASYKVTINDFFENVFSKEQQDGKVSLFNTSENLLESLIYRNSKLDYFEGLMLFAVINYHLKANQKELQSDDNLRNYLRVCRNFILKINQKGNRAKKLQFVPDIRTRFYQDIIQTFNIIFDDQDVYGTLSSKETQFSFRKDNIKEEIYKANISSKHSLSGAYIQKLEDHNYLKGDLHNFNALIADVENLPLVTELFYEIFGNVSDSLLIRSLLSIGDYSIWVGYSQLGGLSFFGQRSDWQRILIDKDNSEKLNTIFKSFFHKLISLTSTAIEDKLNTIIEEGLKKVDLPLWQYLFIKYPQITNETYNLFCFPNNEDHLHVEKLLYGTSLRSYHINPFIKAVIESDGINVQYQMNICMKAGRERSIIPLKYTAIMRPIADYWYINAQRQDYSKHQKVFNLKQIEGKNEFCLYPTKDRDFVEIAVDFINYIYK
jgi:hypothetical protein